MALGVGSDVSTQLKAAMAVEMVDYLLRQNWRTVSPAGEESTNFTTLPLQGPALPLHYHRLQELKGGVIAVMYAIYGGV